MIYKGFKDILLQSTNTLLKYLSLISISFIVLPQNPFKNCYKILKNKMVSSKNEGFSKCATFELNVEL